MSLRAFLEQGLRQPKRMPLSSTRRCTIVDVPIDRLTMDEAATAVLDGLRNSFGKAPILIMGPNAQLITLAQKDIRFYRALRASSLNVPDGISVVLASRLLGIKIPERVPGGELMERLCREAADHKLSIFLLGGLPGAAVEAALRLQDRYPALSIAGVYCPPRGFEHDSIESAHIHQLITKSSPDLLFVALGAPRQEMWMLQNCPSLPVGAAMSVGAAFDTLAGLRRRAPLWTQKLGMEWLYRLVQEPRRLWRRYLIGNTQFIYLVLRQLFLFGRQNEQAPINQSQEAGTSLQTACSSWSADPQP